MRRDAPSLGYNGAFCARDGRRRRAIPTFWKGERCAQHDLPKVVEVSSSGGRDAYSNSGRWCLLQRLHTLKAESPSSSRVIPKAACIWILGEGHSASRRSVGTACVRWRAPWLRWVGCEQVGQSPHGRDGHVPSFALQSLISKCQWYKERI